MASAYQQSILYRKTRVPYTRARLPLQNIYTDSRYCCLYKYIYQISKIPFLFIDFLIVFISGVYDYFIPTIIQYP